MSTINNPSSWKSILEKIGSISESFSICNFILSRLQKKPHSTTEEHELTFADLPKKIRRISEDLARKKFPNDPHAAEKAILEAKDLWLSQQRLDDFKSSLNRKAKYSLRGVRVAGVGKYSSITVDAKLIKEIQNIVRHNSIDTNIELEHIRQAIKSSWKQSEIDTGIKFEEFLRKYFEFVESSHETSFKTRLDRNPEFV